jgi:hypothetical protein
MVSTGGLPRFVFLALSIVDFIVLWCHKLASRAIPVDVSTPKAVKCLALAIDPKTVDHNYIHLAIGVRVIKVRSQSLLMSPALLVELDTRASRLPGWLLIAQIAFGAGHSGTTAGASVFTLSQLELVFLANSAAVLAEGASHRRARRSGSDSDSWD